MFDIIYYSNAELCLYKITEDDQRKEISFGNNKDFKSLTSVTFHDVLIAGEYWVEARRSETKIQKQELFLRIATLNTEHSFDF